MTEIEKIRHFINERSECLDFLGVYSDLEIKEAIVYLKKRRKDYGDYETMCKRIANDWQSEFLKNADLAIFFKDYHVAMALAILKKQRLIKNKKHKDSRLDYICYRIMEYELRKRYN